MRGARLQPPGGAVAVWPVALRGGATLVSSAEDGNRGPLDTHGPDSKISGCRRALSGLFLAVGLGSTLVVLLCRQATSRVGRGVETRNRSPVRLVDRTGISRTWREGGHPSCLQGLQSPLGVQAFHEVETGQFGIRSRDRLSERVFRNRAFEGVKQLSFRTWELVADREGFGPRVDSIPSISRPSPFRPFTRRARPGDECPGSALGASRAVGSPCRRVRKEVSQQSSILRTRRARWSAW